MMEPSDAEASQGWYLAMFEKETALLMPLSCSAVNNSLAVHLVGDVTWLAFPHRNQLAVVKVAADGVQSKTMSRETNTTKNITQVAWCNLGAVCYLVVAGTFGVDFYNRDASLMLYSFPYSKDETRCFTRGLTSFAGKICVGISDGTILAFSTDKGTEGDIYLSQKTQTQTSAICAMASDDMYLASADESGNIVLWLLRNGQITKSHLIEGFDSPCTCVSLIGGLVAAGYGSGHVRVFDRVTGRIRAEATAHARWITALDASSVSGLVLTVAEDSLVKVWRVTDTAEPLVHKFSCCQTDSRLMGARFTRADGARFALAAYDQKSLHCYSM